MRPLSPLLMRMAAASMGLLLISVIGLLVDPRLIGGAPAWLKPAKFGISGATYIVTLAWMVRDLPRTRLLRAAEWLIGVILVSETAVIMVQVARGRLSHFNVDTPLDIAIFSSMGIGIAVVWIMSAVVLVQHLRMPAADRALAVAFRVGLLLNIAGAGTGWLMTQPRPEQMAAMQRGERPYIAGSHTIGAPDGGPGLPITQWSRDHGDLRIPHFIGMHAWQLLPLLVLGVRRVRKRANDRTEAAVLFGASALCATVFIAALLQALAGHPLVPPSWGFL